MDDDMKTQLRIDYVEPKRSLIWLSNLGYQSSKSI